MANQNLFETIKDITGHISVQDDMESIKQAIVKDNELFTKEDVLNFSYWLHNQLDNNTKQGVEGWVKEFDLLLKIFLNLKNNYHALSSQLQKSKRQ